MSDLQKLIQDILREHADSDLFQDKVYSDTPILYTASQMANYTPPIYLQMKQLVGNSYAEAHSREYVFYKQAQFMADHEDNCPYTGDYCCYYPTYQQMSVAQLRGYFTWRTAIRHGEFKPACSSYKFVYIYELLALVGADGPEDAFEKLIRFWQNYRRFDHWMDSYLHVWLCDFAAYYNVPPEMLQDVSDTSFEDALYRLNHCTDDPEPGCEQKVSDEQLLEALSVLSAYNPMHSRMYRQQPHVYTRLICNGLRSYLRYTKKNNKIPLPEKLFGSIHTHAYEIFGGAVFYDAHPRQTVDYTVHEYYRYHCSGGKWQCTRLYGQRCKSRVFGVLIKNMEAHIRDRLSFSPPLKSEKPSRTLINLLDKEIDTFLNEEQAARQAAAIALAAQKQHQMLEATRLNTDLLAEIRRSADATRDKLLADIPEESDEFSGSSYPGADGAHLPIRPDCPDTADTTINTAEPIPPADNTVFTAAELSFLQALVADTAKAFASDAAAVARAAGTTPDLLADTVNEKLLDFLGDTAVFFENGKPCLMEDYLDDISSLLG